MGGQTVHFNFKRARYRAPEFHLSVFRCDFQRILKKSPKFLFIQLLCPCFDIFLIGIIRCQKVHLMPFEIPQNFSGEKIREAAAIVAPSEKTLALVCQRIRPHLELDGLAGCAYSSLDVPGSAGRVGGP